MKNIFFLFVLLINLLMVAQTKTNIPDENFEQALIDLGYDTGPIDHVVPTNNIKNIHSLDVSGKNISDLTGIQSLLDLESLLCFDNSLEFLDLSKNRDLRVLMCDSNRLKQLDVSKNVKLEVLFCHANALTYIDVSKNTALEKMNISHNKLRSIDVSSNLALRLFQCSHNEITSLDVHRNSALTLLDCCCNSLTSLNVKNGTNARMTFFRAQHNCGLGCIVVDDRDYSTENWKRIDDDVHFNERCQ